MASPYTSACRAEIFRGAGGAGDSPAHGGGQANRLPHQVCRQEPVVDRIDALPSTLVLDLNGKAAGEWIFSSFRYAAQELAAARAGTARVPSF